MKYKLVAFDMDGTIGECETSSSWQLIREVFGIPNIWKKYQDGLITREEAMKMEYGFWRYMDAKKDKIKKLLKHRYRLAGGAKELVGALKKAGVKVVIISEGPCLAVSQIAKELGIEDFACNKIVFDSAGYALETKPTHPSADVRVSKALALNDFAEKTGITPKECAVVGNDMEDSEMFKAAGLSIALNPRDDIRYLADAVVNDLKSVLDYLV